MKRRRTQCILNIYALRWSTKQRLHNEGVSGIAGNL